MNPIQKNVLIVCIGASIYTISNAGYAGEGKRERRGPPPEALEACADLSEQQACQFTSPRGDQLSGTCVSPPKDESMPLACRPKGRSTKRGNSERGGSDQQQG